MSRFPTQRKVKAVCEKCFIITCDENKTFGASEQLIICECCQLNRYQSSHTGKKQQLETVISLLIAISEPLLIINS